MEGVRKIFCGRRTGWFFENRLTCNCYSARLSTKGDYDAVAASRRESPRPRSPRIFFGPNFRRRRSPFCRPRVTLPRSLIRLPVVGLKLMAAAKTRNAGFDFNCFHKLGEGCTASGAVGSEGAQVRVAEPLSREWSTTKVETIVHLAKRHI